MHKRYMPAVRDFVAFVADNGDSVDGAAECEYWLAFYMHTIYVTGLASKSRCNMAIYGSEFFMPEARHLKLPRACMRGWDAAVRAVSEPEKNADRISKTKIAAIKPKYSILMRPLPRLRP